MDGRLFGFIVHGPGIPNCLPFYGKTEKGFHDAYFTDGFGFVGEVDDVFSIDDESDGIFCTYFCGYIVISLRRELVAANFRGLQERQITADLTVQRFKGICLT